MLLLAVLFINVDSKSEQRHSVEIVKRHLRWDADKYILPKEDFDPNLRIDYLQPHSESAPVSRSDTFYTAFIVYKRNGEWIFPNTGFFHFIDYHKVKSLGSVCGLRTTRHEAAYYHFYGNCPSDDTGLVASGWCYKSSKGLVFDSGTFNSAGFTYMDRRYYLNNDRMANPIEQQLIQNCFSSWQNHDFPVESWRCETADITVSAPPPTLSTDECDNDCDCVVMISKGSLFDKGSVLQYFIYVVISLLMKQQI